MRAVGALAVLTTHTSFQSGDYVGHGVWSTLLSRLDVGVAIFFVLSGFLLSRPYLARAAAGQRHPSTRHYYRKRAARILPVYAVAVVVALTLVDQQLEIDPAEWLRSLLLVDTYVQPQLPQGLTQMWSLAVEVAFYVMLPLLMVLAVGRTLRSARVAALLIAMAAVSVSWHLSLAQQVDRISNGVPLSWLPSYLTWFAVGIGLALIHVLGQRDGDRRWVVRQARLVGSVPGAAWTTAAALMLLAATPLAGPSLLFVATPAESLFKHIVYALIAGLVVATGVFAQLGGRYNQLMSTPWLRHLGHISYSTFCIHLAVLHGVMYAGGFELFNAPGLVVWALTLAASLLASELLYRLVERPALRLRGGRESARQNPRGSTHATITK